MEKWSGHISRGYHFEIFLPHTPYDQNTGVVRAYTYRETRNGTRRTLVDEEFFKTKSMPYWDVPCQGILLRKGDQRILESAEKNLLKRLPKRTLLYDRAA